jgi:hypothetical protein
MGGEFKRNSDWKFHQRAENGKATQPPAERFSGSLRGFD